MNITTAVLIEGFDVEVGIVVPNRQKCQQFSQRITSSNYFGSRQNTEYLLKYLKYYKDMDYVYKNRCSILYILPKTSIFGEYKHQCGGSIISKKHILL